MVGGAPLRDGDPLTLGSYRLLRRLGEGGMGAVYLAEDAGRRRVAVKVIHPHLASNEQFRARFRSEVALAAKVARFCTAPLLDSDTNANPPYVVTEFVDGPTLTELVAEQGPLSGSQLHALGVGMASALTAIHGAGVVHRDLKPSNVLLSRFGPRVIDFGIARAADAVTSITHSGQYVGSPAYMAPEQFRGDPVTPATDLFAWGAVMAFAGTGRAPFGTSLEAVLYRVVYGDADLDRLDPQLAEVVSRTLSKDPAARPTARQLLDLLVHLEEHGGEPAAAAWTPPVSPPAPPVSPAPPGSPQTPPVSPPPPASFPGPHSTPTPSGVTEKPRRRGGLAIGLVIGILMLCCLGGAGGLGGVVYLGYRVEREDTVTALEAYLDNLKAERYGAAYDYLCDDAKNGVDRQQFARVSAADGRLAWYRVDEGAISGWGGDSGFTIEVEVRREGSPQRTETFFVYAEPDNLDRHLICPR